MRRLLIALLVGLSPSGARAQGWSVDATLGGADHQTVARDVGTRSAILGLRYLGARWLYLSAAAPLDSAGLPWVAAGAGVRVERARGSLRLGADLAGHGHAFRERVLGEAGSGLALEALPFVALERGRARAEAYLGGRTYTSSFADNSFSRGALDGGARLTYAPDARVAVSGTARWVRVVEGGFPRAGVEVEYTDGPVEGWAQVARWLSPELTSASWALGGSIPAGAGGFRVELALQQDAEDPLFWNEPRRFWSLGVSRPLAARATRGAGLAAVAPLGVQSSGRVVLRLPLAESREAPAVGGDFNGWKPVPMRRGAEAWELELTLSPGVYHYAFRRADGEWFVPASIAGRVDDGFGGVNAVLVVRAP